MLNESGQYDRHVSVISIDLIECIAAIDTLQFLSLNITLFNGACRSIGGRMKRRPKFTMNQIACSKIVEKSLILKWWLFSVCIDRYDSNLVDWLQMQ